MQKETDSVYMLQKYHKTTRVHCGGNYLHYTGPTYMPNQRSVVSALRAVGNLQENSPTVENGYNLDDCPPKASVT